MKNAVMTVLDRSIRMSPARDRSRAVKPLLWRTPLKSEEIFSTLMGEDVESRRKFLEDNAPDVKNLDV